MVVTPMKGSGPRSLAHYREIGRVAALTAVLSVVRNGEEGTGKEEEDVLRELH